MKPRSTPKPRTCDDDFAGMDTFHLLSSGHSSFIGHELDDEEFERFKKERREALERKRPCGFTAKWDDEPQSLKRVA